MTAISGLWYHDGRPADDDHQRMQRALALYGPDRGGQWHEDGIALGVRLMRRLPEDRFDIQPVAGGQGRFRLVADLRLDNRAELADMLGLPPDRLAQMADSALALAAWERWGSDCLGRLVGDFALIVWDAAERRLHLARDMMGERPLFFHRGADFVAVASMAKGLHTLPDLPVAPDIERLQEYLALAPERGPRSFFVGVERVQPGHRVEITADGRVRDVEWYRWEFRPPAHRRDPDDYAQELRALFDRAVADRLRTTGAVGSHLSGGFDSSLVTATAAAQLAGRGQRLTAYTHAPMEGVPLDAWPGCIVNEWPRASQVAARHDNLEHVKVTADQGRIGAGLDQTFYYAEIPLLNLCTQVWTSEICRLARQRRQQVMLVGDLGNATVSQAGMERLAHLAGHGRLISWGREALAIRQQQKLSWFRLLSLSAGPWLPPWLAEALRIATGRWREDLATVTALRPAVLHSAAFQERLRQVGYQDRVPMFRNPHDLALFLLRRHDFTAMLRKGQLAAFGVEERDPTADRRLIEFTLALPSDLLLRQGVTRWIYHRAFADRIPAEIRTARQRGYQGADWLTLLRRGQDDLLDQVRRVAGQPQVAGIMDTDFLLQSLSSPLPDQPQGPDQTYRYRYKLLRAVSVAHFIGKMGQSNSDTHLP